VSRRTAYALIVPACVLPRLVVLLHERGSILGDFVEKSDLLARVYLDSGTFGFVPGEPSAYTQPVYGWFMIAVYWIGGRHWWTLGSAQILVAVATALFVFEIGRRYLSARAGLVAAVASSLQPYLVWHDVHANREILDQPLGAAIFFLALLAAERTSVRVAAALGVVTGVAILSNSRLSLLPIVLGVYLLWRRAGWTAAVAVPLLAAIAVAPWVVRNKVQVGCFALTTDARALWKANNVNTYETLRDGHWIDDVPDPNPRPLPASEAGEMFEREGIRIEVDECAQQSYYQDLVFEFWREHPGEKAKIAAEATRMMWDPRVDLREGRNDAGGALDIPRKWVQPAYTVPLFLLALAGLFVVAPALRALALIFVAYETVMAWIFVGTTRYRVPWDFVLALLAAAAIARWWPLRPSSSARWRPFSQKR
jgi:4-amino-4-deoxy-L-arabinose transferase-like glycosyltransferase